MKLKYLLAASVAGISASVVLPAPAAAQQITSAIEGRVTSAEGDAIPGATVTVRDERTGQERTMVTSGDGQFRAGNLLPGGPYTVTATAGGFEGQTILDQFITVQGATAYTFALSSTAVAADTIIVTGDRVQATQLAVGPSQQFGENVLESIPTINRDIRDIIRIDPRVSLSREQGGTVDRITCLGANDRANTFTVDGVIQADVFGLNGTPFAARNSLPLPYDSIKETSVEFAPFDVEYGQFTGCAVNVVTKTGTNDWHGSAFFEYQDDGLTGSTAGGEPAEPAAFKNKRWGASLSGPIIPDTLFFHFGYEQADFTGSPTTLGPIGAGYPNDQDFITVEQYNEIRQVLLENYGIDSGDLVYTNPESNERYFGRVDWFINDNHRLELTYQHLEESKQLSDSLGSDVATGSSNFRIEGTKSDYYAGRLFSQWTDEFSTEIRLSRSDVMDIQDPLAGEATSGNPIPIIRVGVTNPDGCAPGSADCETGYVEAGPGQYRTANDLFQTIDQAKIKANYSSGDHSLTFGVEANRAEIFNLFAINATGMFHFANIDALREGILNNGFSFSPPFDPDEILTGDTDGFLISNSPTGDITGAAASFTRTIWSAYVQDDWQLTDQLSVLAGVRVDWFSGDDAPRENPLFVQRYGYSNAFRFSDLDPVFMPRAGFTYSLDNYGGFLHDTQIKGGVGIFSGGDPGVWYSNAFSNDGFASATGRLSDSQCDALTAGGPYDVLVGGEFLGIPQCAVDAATAAAQAGENSVQSIDPDIEVPTVLRANFGLSTRFGGEGNGFFDNWGFNFDYIFSRTYNPYNFIDMTYAIDPNKGLNGYTVDGRPLYSSIDPLIAGCDATYVGTGTDAMFTNVSDVCFNTGREDEIQLTNSEAYNSHTISAVLTKSANRGLFTEGGSTYFSLGYAWTDSNNNRDNASSTATSNYTRTAAFDRQNPAVSASNFEVKHNITLGLNFKEDFFGEDALTGLGLFFNAQSGTPYSLTFDGNGGFDEISSSRDAALLYVPTGLTDPNLSPSSDPAAVNALLSALQDYNCKYTPGQTVSRNSCNNDWYFDLDLRLSQDIPGPLAIRDRIEIFAVFDNVLNMIDSTWNSRRFQTTDGFLDLVDGAVDSEGRYIISGFNVGSDNEIDVLPSRWSIKLGARYEF